VLVDGVRFTDCTADVVHTTRGAGAATIFHKAAFARSPRRCVWVQQAKGSRLAFIENESSGCTMDGIDMDSHSNFTVSIGNRSHDNKRYGLFFEEGGTHNVGLANDLTGNGMGVNVYSFAGAGTRWNTVVANDVHENARQGLRAGAQPLKDTSSNYFFGNEVTGNQFGLYQDGDVKENYFSLNRVTASKDAAIQDLAGNIVLFNPPVE
jgi:hypothetical protein